MDTGTHIAMGLALGTVATMDLSISQNPDLYIGLFTATVVGSHAPDFDTVFKFKNNASFIRYHRGFSHSIPMIFFWGFSIATLIYVFIPALSFLYLLSWTLFSVILHVFVDLFNAYGTQALRPFSNKWITLGLINTFDPYIFLLHIAGIASYVAGANPLFTWLIIYFVIVLYYIKRFLDKREIVKEIKKHYPETIHIYTSPTVRQNEWRVAFKSKEFFYVGIVINGHIKVIDTFENIPLPDIPLVNVALKDKNIEAFINFSPIYRWDIKQFDHYTEVQFIDLRYRYEDHYPFVALARVNAKGELLSSFTGWIYNTRKLKTKLQVKPSSSKKMVFRRNS